MSLQVPHMARCLEKSFQVAKADEDHQGHTSSQVQHPSRVAIPDLRDASCRVQEDNFHETKEEEEKERQRRKEGRE